MRMTLKQKRERAKEIVRLRDVEKLSWSTIGVKICGKPQASSNMSKIYKQYHNGEFKEISDDTITELVTDECNRMDEEEPFHPPLPIEAAREMHLRPKTEKVTCIVSHVDRKSGEWLPSIHVDIEIPTGLEGDKRTAVMHNEVVKYLMCEEL